MKKIVALVLAMVMVLGLATTAFAAKGGKDFDDAKGNYDWDFVVSPEDPEDDDDATFATYTIEAFAKKNLGDVKPFWAVATLSDVEKTDDFDVEVGGEEEFVKILNAKNAAFVTVDGNTITYFGKADDYNKDGYDAKAVKVTLPVKPLDDKDLVCNTLYALSPATTTYYYVDGVLYMAADAGKVVLNVDGAAVKVVAIEDVKAGVANAFMYKGHDYQVVTTNVTHKPTGLPVTVTKVYCDDCGAEFKFVQGVEEAATAVFGTDNYQEVKGANFNYNKMLWMELVTPAIPGVSAGTVVAPEADSDKVESPKTFDAGIAMYVGMSVMAAAGSAVVLKKKD